VRPILSPPLDPLAHRAAIDALEAQRAAYRRYARTVEANRATLGDGNGDRASAVVEEAASGFDALERGARQLEPLVERVTQSGSADQVREMQRRMDELMHEARAAEMAIRNLSTQLEAWRDAYGRQLAELGITPGTSDGSEPAEPAARTPYTAPSQAPRILDRRG
jgi:hypothetical protein